MPDELRSLDRLTIPNPCNADWDSMSGNDRVRFCEHCSLHVNNLSAMTREEAMRLVTRSQGRICVRFIKGPSGSLLTETTERLYRIGRRASRIAAGTFTAALTLSSAVAQTKPAAATDQSGTQVELIQKDTDGQIVTDDSSARVSGTVKSMEDALISDATVVLVDPESGEERNTTSTSNGEYFFESLPAGDYLIWVRKHGFTTSTDKLSLPAKGAVRLDVTLRDRRISIMGGAMMSLVAADTPLRKAICDNDLAKVRALAYTDPNLNQTNEARGTSLLAEAVEHGNREIVAVLLDAGAGVNHRSRWGTTALMSLTESATPELVRDLISAGANLNARDDGGDNPLMDVAGSVKPAVLTELIRAGSRIDTTNSTGETALFSAARSNSAEAVSLLIEAGLNVNAKNDEGQNALMAIAADGSFEKIKTLIERGADTSLVDDSGRTALMLASFNQDPHVAELLLASGSKIDARDEDGETALLVAAERGPEKTVLLLIYAGAQIEAKDNEGRTALLRAAMSGNVENVTVLLNAGADVTAKDNEGKTALALALDIENHDVVSVLKERGGPK
jgi:ankyrin repeat protein